MAVGSVGSWTLEVTRKVDHSHTGPYSQARALQQASRRVQIPIMYIHRPNSKDIGATLRPKCLPYSYIDPLGQGSSNARIRTSSSLPRAFIRTTPLSRLRLASLLPGRSSYSAVPEL